MIGTGLYDAQDALDKLVDRGHLVSVDPPGTDELERYRIPELVQVPTAFGSGRWGTR